MTPQEFLKGKEWFIDACFVESGKGIPPKIGVFDPRTGEKLYLKLVSSITIQAPFGIITSYIEPGKPIVERVYYTDGRVLQVMRVSPYGIEGKTQADVEVSRSECVEWIKAIETMRD